MGLGNGLAVEDAADEGTREGVASADGVSHRYLRRLLEGDVAGGEDVTAISAASEDEHVEVVLAKDEPALVLNVKTGIAEHTAYEHQFLVVNLQDVAALE